MTTQRLTFIGGAGKIGWAIISGLLDTKVLKPAQITVTARHRSSLTNAKTRKLHTSLNNREACAKADIIVLCVHPDELPDVIKELCGTLAPNQLLISVVTGCTTESIAALCGQKMRVVRAMPNTPVMIREAVTCIAAGKHAKAKDVDVTRKIFACVGNTEVIDEKHMNAATGLGGCGPAYVFKIIEALSEGGVKMGLPRATARHLAAQTLKGAAELVLQTGKHPAELKDAVTTPGGCTIDGLAKLEEHGLSNALIQAVETATRKASSLS